MSRTIHTVLVHFEDKAAEEVEVLETHSGHRKDIEQIAQEKARLVQLKAGQSARDRPRATWAEHQSSREVTFEE